MWLIVSTLCESVDKKFKIAFKAPPARADTRPFSRAVVAEGAVGVIAPETQTEESCDDTRGGVGRLARWKSVQQHQEVGSAFWSAESGGHETDGNGDNPSGPAPTVARVPRLGRRSLGFRIDPISRLKRTRSVPRQS
jgi:hypothetical protein